MVVRGESFGGHWPCDALFVFPKDCGTSDEQFVDVFLMSVVCKAGKSSAAPGDMYIPSQVRWLSLPAAPLLQTLPALRARLTRNADVQNGRAARIRFKAKDLCGTSLAGASVVNGNLPFEDCEAAVQFSDAATWSSLLALVCKSALARLGLAESGLREALLSRIAVVKEHLILAASLCDDGGAVGQACYELSEPLLEEVHAILKAMGFGARSRDGAARSASAPDEADDETAGLLGLVSCVLSPSSRTEGRTGRAANADDILSLCVQVIARLRQLVDARVPSCQGGDDKSGTGRSRLVSLARALGAAALAETLQAEALQAEALQAEAWQAEAWQAEALQAEAAPATHSLATCSTRSDRHGDFRCQHVESEESPTEPDINWESELDCTRKEADKDRAVPQARAWLRSRGLLAQEGDDCERDAVGRGSEASAGQQRPSQQCLRARTGTPGPGRMSGDALRSPYPCQTPGKEDPGKEEDRRQSARNTQGLDGAEHQRQSYASASRRAVARARSTSTPSKLCKVGTADGKVSSGMSVGNANTRASSSSTPSTLSDISSCLSVGSSIETAAHARDAPRGVDRNLCAQSRDASAPPVLDAVRSAQRRVNACRQRWADDMRGCSPDGQAIRVVRTRSEIFRRRDARIRKFMEAQLRVEESSGGHAVAPHAEVKVEGHSVCELARSKTVASMRQSSSGSTKGAGHGAKSPKRAAQPDPSQCDVDLSFLEAEAEAMAEGLCTPSPPPVQSPLPA